MSTSVKYGIDFGTTNSSIAIVKNASDGTKNAVTLDIDFEAPYVLVKSVVAYKDADVYIGNEGLTYISGNAENPVRQVKILLMSQKKDGLVLTHNGKKKYISDVMAAILKRMKVRADDKLEGVIPDGVVMGVPVETTRDEKNVYLKALVKAGFYTDEEEAFNKTEFIEEPVAVALFYGNQIAHQNKYGLVFDFGGGTLDLAVVDLKAEGSTHKVVAKYGYEGAGEKFTGILFSKVFFPKYCDQYCDGSMVTAARVFRKMGYTARGTEGLWQELGGRGGTGWKFINELDAAKQMLSSNESYSFSFHLDETDECPEIDIPPVILTRQEFEQAIEAELDNIDGAITSLFRSAKCKELGISKKDIDEVLLAGGSSIIPAVQNKLASIFGKEKIYFDNTLEAGYYVIEMTAIARGLALAGYKDSEVVRIDDITSFSYGFYDSIKNEIREIIPKGISVSEISGYDFSRNGLPPENYKYKKAIVQKDKALPYFYIDICEGDNVVKTLHFDKEEHSGNYTLYFYLDVKRALLEVHVYDTTFGKWVNDIQIGDRSIQIRKQ